MSVSLDREGEALQRAISNHPSLAAGWLPFCDDIMPATAEDTANASQEWQVAQKIRRSVQHELERVKRSAGDGSEIEHFKKLDNLIAE